MSIREDIAQTDSNNSLQNAALLNQPISGSIPLVPAELTM